MTALTLVMGFYELSAWGQKNDGKSDANTSLGGRLIKAHDKHAQCAVVGLRLHPLLRPSGTIHSKKIIACQLFPWLDRRGICASIGRWLVTTRDLAKKLRHRGVRASIEIQGENHNKSRRTHREDSTILRSGIAATRARQVPLLEKVS